MKRIAIITSVLLVVCSCDSFRRMAGRPTSDEIQAKRELIAANEAAERARQAELEEIRHREAAAVADSLAAVDSIAAYGIELRGAKYLSKDTELCNRYYVIVGAYRSRANAQRVIEMLGVCGFNAVPIKYCNGSIIVGACPCDHLADCYRSYQKLVKLPFCPPSSWILDIAR